MDTSAPQCPIIRAFAELKSGGWDDEQDSDTNVISGGRDKSYVCDDVCYHVNFHTISVARLEADKALTAARAATELGRLYPYYTAGERITYGTIYGAIVRELFSSRLLFVKFATIVQKVSYLNSWIIGRVKEMARRGEPINATIPDLVLPAISEHIGADPAAVTAATNAVVAYLNELRVSGLGRFDGLSPIESLDVPQIDLSAEVELPRLGTTPRSYLNLMKALATAETTVCSYIKELEAYHCRVISVVNDVFDRITAMIKK